MMRKLFVVVTLFLCCSGSCDAQPQPQPSSVPADTVTREEFEAFKSQLATAEAERDDAKAEANKLKQQFGYREINLKLSQHPETLTGVLRPAQSMCERVTWDEICFDPQTFDRWYGPLDQYFRMVEQRRIQQQQSKPQGARR